MHRLPQHAITIGVDVDGARVADCSIATGWRGQALAPFPRRMKVSIIIASYGDQEWRDLHEQRAYPSAEAQAPHQIVSMHVDESCSISALRNKAAEAATGDWLCFLDADDELESGYLHEIDVAWLGQVDDPLFIPAVRFWGFVNGTASVPNIHEPFEVMNHAVIGTLVSRDLFKDVGGFPEYPIYEDWALWLSCLRAGAKRIYVPRAVYRAHVRPDGRNTQDRALATRTYQQIRREHKAALRA